MSNIFNIYKSLSENGTNSADLSDIKPSTFYKYLNLFKKAGFEVVKAKRIYQIIQYTDIIKLSDAEIGLIAYLLLLSNMLFPKTKNKVFSKMIDKMLQFTNEETKEAVLEKFELMKKASNTTLYQEKLEMFEKYKDSNLMINVTLKTGETLLLSPEEVIFKNKKIFFSFIDDNKEIKQIDINKIVKLSPKTNNKILKYESKEIVFELYGRLAKIYLLKEHERIVDFNSDKIVVANGASDKNALFKRLLRYDTLCKIKHPKKNVREFEKLIEKSLENIENITDNNFKEVMN